MKKRFYQEVSAISLEDGGHGVALDGRPVRTPKGNALTIPTTTLAAAIASEWDAQQDGIEPLSMPMMRLAVTAIDGIGAARGEVVDRIAAFGGTDLLCYRAAGPEGLVQRQAAQWQPLLDWAAETHGARLTATEGIVAVAQDPAALAALRAAVEAFDDFPLAVLSQLTAACGSLVLALAAASRRLDVETAVAASQLDELWQAEKWGHEAEAAKRRQALADEIADAMRFLDLLED